MAAAREQQPTVEDATRALDDWVTEHRAVTALVVAEAERRRKGLQRDAEREARPDA